MTAVLASMAVAYLAFGVMFAVGDRRRGYGVGWAANLLLWPFTLDIRLATWVALREIRRQKATPPDSEPKS